MATAVDNDPGETGFKTLAQILAVRERKGSKVALPELGNYLNKL